MGRRYVILDVFTDQAYAGNPLAVVLDTEKLDSAAMQAIAREFNLSETVFLLPAEDEAHKARLRIFTPNRELPFAGHPTVGSAVLLALLAGGKPKGEVAFAVEEAVGVVPCRVTLSGRTVGVAEFTLPRLPEPEGDAPDAALAAAALGLDQADIGFDAHRPSRFTAGNPFSFVPLASLDALGRVAPDTARWASAFGTPAIAVYAYTRDTGDEALQFRSRMVRGGFEDPATGSAVAAFAGAIMAFDRPPDGAHTLAIGQGFEMGRPSVIRLGLDVQNGALASATIGGAAVVVAEGTLLS